MKIIVTIYSTPSSGRLPHIYQFKATEKGLWAAISTMNSFRRSRIASTRSMTLMNSEGLHCYDGDGEYFFTIPPDICIKYNVVNWRKCIGTQDLQRQQVLL